MVNDFLKNRRSFGFNSLEVGTVSGVAEISSLVVKM